MPKHGKLKSRTSLQSTEPQARKVLEEMESRKPKSAQPPRDTGGKTTAKSPPGIQKTKAQGAAEYAAAQKRIEDRIAAAKKKKKQ